MSPPEDFVDNFVVDDGGDFGPKNTQSVEERYFQVALMMVESMFSGTPPIGYRTRKATKDAVRQTMEKTLNKPEIREVLARNVDIWMRLHLAFHYAIPAISDKSLRESFAETAQPDYQIPESSTLIADNHASLQEELTLLNNLLVIARNMLAIKEIAQDICAAVQLDKQIIKLIELCVRVTSKGYDGENLESVTRGKVNDVIELYKKLLVTSLQFLHNMTMGNDRLKMAFWFEMLFDNELHNDYNTDFSHDLPPDQLRVEVVHLEVQNWLQRNWTKTPQAQEILQAHEERVPFGHTAGPLPEEPYGSAEYTKWVQRLGDQIDSPEHPSPSGTLTAPVWLENAPSKFEQDRLYGRVSHEIDVWWKLVRDVNYDEWTQSMEPVEVAMQRAEQAKHGALTRWIRQHPEDGDQEYDHQRHYAPDPEGDEIIEHDDIDERSQTADNGEEEELEEEEEEEEGEEEEEEEEDDEPYPDGEPLRGFLTEIPNILDTKQIEALHMTVKACIVDAMGSGLTKSGENLQKTRCKMFLALDCGKNLLREMLVFIAVWEQAETQFIFQITAQIIESFHHNALLPFAWNSLRIAKDIISPAQTVLLRLINYMFRARNGTSIYNDQKDYLRDAKLIFFLYNYFRCRVVPDCIALIYAQAKIRNGEAEPHDFPVDLWDMERAKDGLSQYLDFIVVVADIPKMKPLLLKWEATHELVTLLNALEAGVTRKPLVDPVRNNAPIPRTTPHIQGYNGHTEAISAIERPYDQITGGMNDMNLGAIEPTTMPVMHDTPQLFPWTGIKVQIVMIFTSLVAPVSGRSGPGNPTMQAQILKHGGILPLLNCCVYDGHNEYLKERTTLALKWIMDGCPEAQAYVSELAPLSNQNPNQHHDTPPQRRQTGP